MKPAGRGFSMRPHGVRRRSIHDPRSMPFVMGVGRERCIKTSGSDRGLRTDRVGDPTPLYEREGVESLRIDGMATPVHTEVYE